MSIRIMRRKCDRCGKVYAYNPSTGNFGIICPRCYKMQIEIASFAANGKKVSSEE